MNSRTKGKRGELEFAQWLREHWHIDARRGQQHRGGPESPDVLTSLDGKVHFEVKRTEKLQLHAAMRQAEDEAPSMAVPVVAHRRNDGEWLLTLPAREAVDFAAALLGAGGEEG